MHIRKKLGIVDTGGGLRGIYGAGIMDYCMDNNIQFDYGIGVSAGSANIISLAANQRGRNYYYFIDYSFRSEYMSIRNFLKSGSYINMDYIYSTLYNNDGERPLDYSAVKNSSMRLNIVATSAATGKPVYFSQDDLSQDCYDVIKASCSIPIVNRPYFVNGIPYYDGGISDPIPYKKAFEDGCECVVVILTKPLLYIQNNNSKSFYYRLINKKYPAVSELVHYHNELYRQQITEIKQYEKMGKILILAPETIYGMKTLTRDKVLLQKLYDDAYKQAEMILNFIKK